jgi:hypothetical protein
MNDLRELLDVRAEANPAEILAALKDGLSRDPRASGLAADFHRFLLDYFRMEEVLIDSGHLLAFERYPEAARRLVAMMDDQGEANVAALMQSFLEGKPRALGALQEGLNAVAAEITGPAAAFLDGFTEVALGSEEAAADIELSLAWEVVEEAIAERVVLLWEDLAFKYGKKHRQTMARATALDALASRHDVGALIRAIAGARNPRVLAGDGEVAAEERLEVPVRHQLRQRRLGPAAALPHQPQTAQLRALYEVTNGAELFIPITHKPKEAGLLLIPDHQWATEREHVLEWASLGEDDGALPSWTRSLVPLATLPGDSSRWVVPLEGPHAGAVMLTDDIIEGAVRYASIAHFLAALRLFPHEILGNGGYVQYRLGRGGYVSVYPEGYREDS